MNIFKRGQKAVCITSDPWFKNPKGFIGWFRKVFNKLQRSDQWPKKGEVVTVSGAFYNDSMGQTCLFLVFEEYPYQGYDARSFRPLDENFAEEALQNAIKEASEEIIVEPQLT